MSRGEHVTDDVRPACARGVRSLPRPCFERSLEKGIAGHPRRIVNEREVKIWEGCYERPGCKVQHVVRGTRSLLVEAWKYWEALTSISRNPEPVRSRMSTGNVALIHRLDAVGLQCYSDGTNAAS